MDDQTHQDSPLSNKATVIQTIMPQPAPEVESLLTASQQALEDMKAHDMVTIDLRPKSGIADFLVIASGTSTRHVKAIADEVSKKIKELGVKPLGIEGEREAEWVLVDLGDVIVHVMLPRTREYYGLERLWSVGDDRPDGGAPANTDSHEAS